MSLTSLPTTGWRLGALLVLAACYSPANAEAETTQPWAVDTSTLEARSQFIKAREALAIADLETFRQIKQSLSSYPLYDYLEYEELAHQFRTEEPSKTSITKLNAFDTQFQNDTLTGQLTRSLQSRLSETEQWSLFLALSKSRVAGKLSCSRLRANYELGEVTTFTDEVLELWVQPKKHHERCQPVLDALQAQQTPPFKAIWERIFLSFEKDKPKFAEPMLGYLSRYERKQVTNWLEALENPEPFLNSPALKKDSQLNRRRFVDLVLAWSKSDPVAAMNHWLENKDRFRFYKDRYYETHRLLAMRGAYRRLPEAYEWLMGVPARDEDLELKEWRIRAALFEQNWLEVIKNIRRLPADEQEQDHWAYWEARAFEENGHTEKAKTIYAKLAGLQSYHGFLSADRLDQEYAIKNQPLPNDSAQIEALAELPRMIRAREFHHAGVTWEARREWNAALKNADKDTVAAATQLAMHWKMEDRALATAGRIKDFRSAIDVRFPVLFESLVTAHTTEHSLDPSFVLGLMRRESGFMADAKSPVGATGLMQLMPKTAKHVADMKGKKNWRGDLTDPATNIEFGSYYFRHVLDRFGEREILAAAAYNAGPTRVNSWLPESAMAADVWIDTIPYSETRRYVRALLAYAAIYDVHLTGQPKRLSERLDDIQPKEQDGV